MGLTTESEMKKIVRQLAQDDKKFIPIIDAAPLCTIGRKRATRNHYEVIVTSIISQQLAIKAADTIRGRLVDLAGGALTPDAIVKLSATQLREVGVSGAKARAISELTEATLSERIHFHKFARMNNHDIASELTQLWGVGRWTVEMFLIFHLGRLDIWPVGDLAVRRGWEKIHRLKEEIEPKKLDAIRKKFDGYQSVVAWYCWRATEGDSASW
jgi:DNA-3-methyladenine glycosylase II